MISPKELNSILERITKRRQTEADIAVLRQLLSSNGQNISQIGKYPVNLGQGQDIQIGDRIYQGVDAEAIREIVRSILIELKASKQTKEIKKEQVSVDELVQEVRRKIQADVQGRYGTMRVLDMTQPIELDDIYTDVNILEKIIGRRRIDIKELMKSFDPDSEDFERYGLGKITEKRVPGLDAVKRLPKLMVLGKPGSGKTTFLKYLAIQCICGHFLSTRIPIFITLKQFAEVKGKPNIIGFLYQELDKYGITKEQVDRLLKYGKLLILLDGLDEVKEEDSSRVINQILDFSRKYSFSNDFTGRLDSFNKFLLEKFNTVLDELKTKNSVVLATISKEPYITSILKDLPKKHDFTDRMNHLLNDILDKVFYEMSVLNLKEIESIREIENKSTIKRTNNTKKDEVKSKYISQFSSQLKNISLYQYLSLFQYQNSENTYVNHFVLTCRIAAREEKFEHFTEVEVADFDIDQIQIFVSKWFDGREYNPSQLFMQQLSLSNSIKELATNPLLLTLLCLVFEETLEFPSNRAELYKEGANILLKKWDAQRLIKREQVYKQLSSQRKEDLLSHIALITFENKDYFFKQKEVEKLICDYIRNLPGAKTEQEALQLDSEAVLKSIEAQHGLLIERAKNIYSFSHLTFQEYFTARRIVTNSNPEALETALKNLSSHIGEHRWREVFLLAIGMLPNAERLLILMTENINAIGAKNEKLQKFLTQIYQRSLLLSSSHKPEAIRALHIAYALHRDYSLDMALKETFEKIDSYVNDHPFALPLADYMKQAIHLVRELQIHRSKLYLERTNFYISYTLDCTMKPDYLLRSMQQLGDSIPDSIKEVRNFKEWWKSNGKVWIQNFKNLTLLYKNIDFNIEISDDLRKSVSDYYNANKLLIECLNSDCYVSLEVRQEIEETLLLPVAEIEKGKREKRVREISG